MKKVQIIVKMTIINFESLNGFRINDKYETNKRNKSNITYATIDFASMSIPSSSSGVINPSRSPFDLSSFGIITYPNLFFDKIFLKKEILASLIGSQEWLVNISFIQLLSSFISLLRIFLSFLAFIFNFTSVILQIL